MSKSHQVIVPAVALALSALVMARFACAAEAADVPPSMTVRYNDLNLDSPEGVASLYKRIQNAATAVCRGAQGPESVSRLQWTGWKRCYYPAIANAVRGVHNDKLSAYYWQGTREGNPSAERGLGVIIGPQS
jgi:UrcA family protein